MKKLIFYSLLAVTVVSCKKEPTSWQSDWAAPVINDTLNLSNLVNDTTLTASPSGFYELDLTRTLFSLDINEVVEIPDTTIHKTFDNGGFLNFPVGPGVSFVTSSEENTLDLEDIQLKKVILKQGFVDIKVQNPIQTIAIFDVSLPGTSKDGVTFLEQYSAPAGTNSAPGVVERTVDLSGYELDLTGLSGNTFNTFVSQITVSSDPNGQTVNFANTDLVIVDATFRDVKVDYARGYFGNRVLSDTVDVNLDELSIYESGAIDISSASIQFEIENGIKAGAEGRIHMAKNENALGNVVNLIGGQIGTGFFVDPATGSWNSLTPSVQSLEFTSSNSNIEDYLENLGRKHTIGYSIELNPWGNTSGGWDQIFPNSTLRVKMKAQMPLTIGMDALVLKDTFDVNLNQDPAKTHVVSGELILNAKNAFPISADVELFLMDANGTVLHTVNGTDRIESAQFGEYDATYDMNISESNVRFILPDNVVADVNRIKKIAVRSTFNTLNSSTNLSEPMIIPVGAFLGVKLRTRFKTENRF